MVVLLASLVANVWLLVRRAMGATVTDWTSTTAAMCFMGVIQTLLLGVIGECAGKVFMETKLRLRSIVSKRTWEKGNI